MAAPPVRKIFAACWLGLAAWAGPSAQAAPPFGVLSVKAVPEPEQIDAGGKTQISVVASDGFQKPVPQATITIHAATGWFESSNQDSVIGYTDAQGLFLAVWHANQQTPMGFQTFQVTAVKNGYISKFPVAATARVAVGDAPQEDGAGGEGWRPGLPALRRPQE